MHDVYSFIFSILFYFFCVVVTADKTATMKIWDIRTFECVQTLSLEDCKGINSFTPVGSQRYFPLPSLHSSNEI